MINYLTFSDAAKFADIARNMFWGLGYGGSFSFWFDGVSDLFKRVVVPVPWVPPVMPLSIFAFFKVFGLNDYSVMATSLFYFILLLIVVFLLAKKVFKSNLVGFLSVLTIAFSQNIIDYATSGASEIALMFEIVASAYFLTFRKRWANILAFMLMALMYFTRPQGFIYIAGLILYWLLLRFNAKKTILSFLAILFCGFMVDKFILSTLAGKYFLYPILGRGLSTIDQAVVSGSTSEFLRGSAASFPLVQIFKKVFYDLYNFYKLLPSILSPYLFTLFLIGLFQWDKDDKTSNALKVATIFMFLLTFLITAISIPFFRYLHPVIPLVYIFSVGIMVWIINKFAHELTEKFKEQKFVAIVSSFLVLFFIVGQTLGVIFLDSRYKAKLINKEKPPVYVALSYKLKEITEPTDVIVTNLDTWGSWYGERKTVWFPLKPDQLIPPEGQLNPFDAIYLTSYLMDDENYYMGEEWRQIFYNPENPENEFIADNFELKGLYQVTAEETYEKQDARAVLLVRKRN